MPTDRSGIGSVQAYCGEKVELVQTNPQCLRTDSELVSEGVDDAIDGDLTILWHEPKELSPDELVGHEERRRESISFSLHGRTGGGTVPEIHFDKLVDDERLPFMHHEMPDFMRDRETLTRFGVRGVHAYHRRHARAPRHESRYVTVKRLESETGTKTSGD